MSRNVKEHDPSLDMVIRNFSVHDPSLYIISRNVKEHDPSLHAKGESFRIGEVKAQIDCMLHEACGSR